MNDLHSIIKTFARTWNSSTGGKAEIGEALGYDRKTVDKLAQYCRLRKVYLKHLRRGRLPGIDANEINAGMVADGVIEASVLVQLETSPENPFPGSDGVPTLMVHEPTAA